jgi:quinol monooxygenase YgiN
MAPAGQKTAAARKRQSAGQKAAVKRKLAILFRVRAKPGKRQKLLKFLKWDCEFCMREPGTLRFDVLQDPATKNGFYVYEVYKDAAAFKKHQENCPYREWSSVQFKTEVIAHFRVLSRGRPKCLHLPAPVTSCVGGSTKMTSPGPFEMR